MPYRYDASGCFWAGTCNCSCSTCKKSGPYHCGSHGSGCHINCNPKDGL